MIKHLSRGRKDYKRAYRLLRLDINIYDERSDIGLIEDAWDCAILSYDYYDSEFSGWINRHRMEKFWNLFMKRSPQKYWPF